MAFLIYKKESGKLIATRESYSLAGYGLVYRSWEARGKPTDQGWHVSTDDLIKAHTNGKESYDTRRLLIDFAPQDKKVIGIIELLDIHVYTYAGANPGEASWSPMMLTLRDIMYQEFDREISKEEKEQKISLLDDPEHREDFVEFLYLQGSKKGWNWGKNGMTNAAFIQKPARQYFRQHF